MLRYLSCESGFLFRVGTVDALLHHAAAMLVAGYLHALVNHCIIDELIVSGFPSLENLLDDMIAIDVFS